MTWYYNILQTLVMVQPNIEFSVFHIIMFSMDKYPCMCVSLSLKRSRHPTPEEKENILVALTNDGYLKVMSADTGHVLRSIFLSTITKYRYVPASEPYVSALKRICIFDAPNLYYNCS